MNVEERIRGWVKSLTTRIGGVEVRDVYRERNTPLTLDSRELHRINVSGERGKENDPQS